jgi:hypothetical protein
MIGDTITCEHIGCGVVFRKKTHNQRYHDDECCRLATNAKIMQKYYQRRAQKLGHARYCDVCASKLSKYNSESKCNSCLQQSETTRNNMVVDMLANVVWQ